MMKENPLIALENLGQSIWLDYIRRDLIISGELRRLITEDGLRGMTSNPAFWVLSELSEVGIDIATITKTLENDGVKKFVKSFDKLMDAIIKTSSEK